MNDWNTNPILCNRKSTISLGFKCEMSCPSINRFPEVGVSNPPIRFSRVVLPEPEGPTMAVNSPSVILIFTLSTACTSDVRSLYVLYKLMVSMIGIMVLILVVILFDYPL